MLIIFASFHDNTIRPISWSLNGSSSNHEEEKGELLQSGRLEAKVRPSSNTVSLLESDLIYTPGRWGNPIVLSEFKLIFFPMPKVACTEWKLFFRTVMGYTDNEELEQSDDFSDIHNPGKNGLKYLSDYPLEEAQHMLNSEEWTRAVFVREPKERILSGYLDKFINNPEFFDRKCCQTLLNETEMGICRDKLQEEDGTFGYFLKHACDDCKDHHWDPQVENIDEKWWDSITFVGYFDSLAPHGQVLLSSVLSDASSLSAWELYGKTGWGPNGTSPFLFNSTIHVTNAHDKLRKYYTPHDEEFVEMHWAIEWEQTVYHFDQFHLFE